MLNRKDDKSTAVVIGNPRSADFEVCILDYFEHSFCSTFFILILFKFNIVPFLPLL